MSLVNNNTKESDLDLKNARIGRGEPFIAGSQF